MSRTLLLVSICIVISGVSATRWPLAAPNSNSNPNQQQQKQQAVQGSSGVQPYQPWQQWQQQIQQQMNPPDRNNGSSQSDAPTPLKPNMQFVTLPQLQRPPQMKQAEQDLQQQQQTISADKFECGKPNMPCGSAIPQGKTCEKGPGWCQPGYFCGYDFTTTEPSRCIPLPEKCGQAGNPCCPSNTDSPHTSLDDKLNRKPFCKDGSYCFFHPPEPGLNNGDKYAGNKGAYACTTVTPDCGSAQGKPCCPNIDKISTNPQLTRSGCSGALYCNYNVLPLGIAAVKPEYRLASMPGTCEANTADCGTFGKSCCISTSASATSFGCGARWNETGQRGYCADPFDSNRSGMLRRPDGRPLLESSSKDAVSTANLPRRASYKELVCTPCPARSESVAENPSRYWPC